VILGVSKKRREATLRNGLMAAESGNAEDELNDFRASSHSLFLNLEMEGGQKCSAPKPGGQVLECLPQLATEDLPFLLLIERQILQRT
jgi:hypothetical protein